MVKLSHWSGCKMPDRTKELFSLFEELATVDLAKVRLYNGSRWLPRNVGAITLSVPLFSWFFGSTRIYVNCPQGAGEPVYNLDGLRGIELVAEELYHAKQQLDQGAARFYAAYLWEYLQHRRRGLSKFAAYNAITFEQEAKAFARKAAVHAAGFSREAA